MESEEDEIYLLIVYLVITFVNNFKNKFILNEKLVAELCEIALENSF